jgi:phosphate-selective porin OprO and OprP
MKGQQLLIRQFVIVPALKRTNLAGIEAGAVWGPLYVYGEIAQTKVVRYAAIGTNNTFKSGFAFASWFLTGEYHPYDATTGVFMPAKIKKPFSVKNGNYGGFEIAAGVNRIDLNSNIEGGEMTNYTASAVWHLNNSFKFTANYTVTKTKLGASPSVITEKREPKLFLMRAQVNL